MSIVTGVASLEKCLQWSLFYLSWIYSHYAPGDTYLAVIPGQDVGIPEYAIVDWEYKMNFLNFLTWRLVATPRVYIESILVESMEHRSVLQLCPILGTPVLANTPSMFRSEYCTAATANEEGP